MVLVLRAVVLGPCGTGAVCGRAARESKSANGFFRWKTTVWSSGVVTPWKSSRSWSLYGPAYDPASSIWRKYVGPR